MNASLDTLGRHRLRVDEYRRMSEHGILAPDARVELIDGEILDMPPVGSTHAGLVNHMSELLFRASAGIALVQVQSPVELSDRSQPQPDLVLLRRRDDFYKRSLPLPSDILLVIEVSDSTLAYDRDVKLPLYARHGIPEVWLVDVSAMRVMTCHDPSPDGYTCQLAPSSLHAVPIRAIDGVRVDLSALF